MRVIAGEAKGRKLKVPKGSSVRPSSGRVRGALFSMLSSLGADMVRVLDLYAGTGSFGIEALSRGAEWVDFVERDPRHTAAIRRNLAALGMTNRGRVCRMSVERALDTLREGYGVVFMDPPYSDPEIGKILERLIASPVVARGTLIVVEHSRHQPLAEKYGNFVSIRERRYGETVVSIFQEESQIVK